MRLSHSDTPDDLKKLIEGRIKALAKVHTLFVQSRWAEPSLHSLVTQELPLTAKREMRACNLRPNCDAGAEYGSNDRNLCMSSQPTRQNIDRYRRRTVASKSRGLVRQTGGSVCAGPSQAGRPLRRLHAAVSGRKSWKTSLGANSAVRCILIGATKGSRAKLPCRLHSQTRFRASGFCRRTTT